MRVRAFSLAEIMVAIGLIAVVVLGIMVVLAGGLQSQTQSAQMLQAEELARQEIESIRQGNFSANPDGTVYDGRLGTAASGGFPPAPYPAQLVLGQSYQLGVSVQRISANLRSVRVDVYWDAKHNLHLETLMNP